VIFTDDPEKRFQDFNDNEFIKIDDNLGIKYERNEILEDTILLLRYNCPDRDCDVACLGWPDLHRHVKTKHGKIMCDLCTRNKKVFTHEHELFSFGDLRKHEKYGDDNPGAVDQSGFKGHPLCGFCNKRFYGDDELYNHCREAHERCHICDRRNGGRNPVYYRNYEELEKHFGDVHFVCLDAECQANKTNVFESEMDLKAHQLSEHPNGLSKDARRDARLVNLSGFDLRSPYQPQRENRRERENRGTGRGRDPNADPLPMSSAQSMSRAELAYQRQMAIQSSQSVSTRNFGGQLTQSTPTTRPQPAAQPPAQPLPAIDDLSLDTHAPRDPSTITPQEQARAQRHTAVIARATQLLKNNNTKLSQFRTHVSSYRSGTIPANDLIDAFFSLFDCPSPELGKLIRELADLYDNEQKRQQLLEAWNNWRSINEDYPSLPGPSGILPGVSTPTTSTTGRRVLKLKSSTAQSSRSAVSREGSWGHANPLQQGQTQPRDAFPALSSAAAAQQRKPAGATPWSTGPVQTTASRLAGAASNRTNPANLRPPPTMSNARNQDMFPSLPAAQKPSTLQAGIHRGTRGVPWLDSPRSGSGSATPVNAWSNGGTTPTPAQAAAALEAEVAAGGEGSVGAAGGKKKGGKGKKKETLFHFG